MQHRRSQRSLLHRVQAQLGVPVRVLDPTPGCPASPVAQQTEGSFRDPAAIAAFAAGVDVLTAEIEHVDTGILAELEARGSCSVHPSSGTLAIIQVGCSSRVQVNPRSP